MAAGNPNFDALLSSTLANYRDTYSDNLSRSFFLFWWLNSQGRKRTEDGGESIIVQLMYGKNQTIRSYSGYETIDTTPQEGFTAIKLPWKQVAGSISISRLEERQNSGEARIINLLQSKVTQSEISMRDSLNGMYFSDGTGNNSKDIHGLQLIVEDGNTWGSYGGIDRSDAANAWWRNQYKVGRSFSANTNQGLADMRNLYNSCSRGNEHPDFSVTDQATYERYENALVPLERYTDQSVGDAGFVNLKFKGLILGYDEQCSAGTLYMLNSKYLEWVVDSQTDLVNTEFVRPENQDAKVSQILLMGNLVCSNCSRQGIYGGSTTAISD